MTESFISSRANKTVTALAKLKDKKERDRQGLYLCEGYKLCSEASGEKTRYALLREDKRDSADYARLAAESGGEVLVLAQGVFEKLTCDKAADGIIFVCEKKQETEPDTETLIRERICVLDCLRDPGNVGTVIRTAAAFGYDRVILGGCADVYNPKTLRASMGAAFKIRLTETDNLLPYLQMLKEGGRRLIAAALTDNGMTLGKCELASGDVPVLGNEGHGVSPRVLGVCDGTVLIAMSGKTESLNAAAAAAVILWEYGRRWLL